MTGWRRGLLAEDPPPPGATGSGPHKRRIIAFHAPVPATPPAVEVPPPDTFVCREGPARQRCRTSTCEIACNSARSHQEYDLHNGSAAGLTSVLRREDPMERR